MRQGTLFGRRRANFCRRMSLHELLKEHRARLFDRRGATNAGTYGTGHAANIRWPGWQRQSDLPTLLPSMRIGAHRWAEIMPNITMIMAGTLDDASWVKPASEIFCDSAQPWVQLGGERRRSPKMPPVPSN